MVWVRAGPFTPEVALTYPEALHESHVREFREVARMSLQALTFHAEPLYRLPSDLEDRLADLNRGCEANCEGRGG